jgi:uncharacterized protein (TIGR02145 family)
MMRNKKRHFVAVVPFVFGVIVFSNCGSKCERQPCENGGVCVDGRCECTVGWTGEDCSERAFVFSENCGTTEQVSYQGDVYDVVQVGSQCWFAENLRTQQYRNGDPIPGSLHSDSWITTESGAQTTYAVNGSVLQGSSDTLSNLERYGRLYNWFAVVDHRGLCPAGWHVPSDEEWTELEETIGGSSVAGALLKSSETESPPWDGTNASGFGCLPGGYRNWSCGCYFQENTSGYWWTSTPSYENLYAWYRGIETESEALIRYDHLTKNGFSVRCLRD